MQIYINCFKQKTLSIIAVFLVMGLCAFNVHAQDDDDSQAWEYSIDMVDLINRRIIIGDLDMTLTSGFKVFNRQGHQLGTHVLQPGIRVSTIPEYRGSQIFISTITVME